MPGAAAIDPMPAADPFHAHGEDGLVAAARAALAARDMAAAPRAAATQAPASSAATAPAHGKAPGATPTGPRGRSDSIDPQKLPPAVGGGSECRRALWAAACNEVTPSAAVLHDQKRNSDSGWTSLFRDLIELAPAEEGVARRAASPGPDGQQQREQLNQREHVEHLEHLEHREQLGQLEHASAGGDAAGGAALLGAMFVRRAGEGAAPRRNYHTDADSTTFPFALRERVVHGVRGAGTVVEHMSDGRTRIAFDSGEEHTYRPSSLHRLVREGHEKISPRKCSHLHGFHQDARESKDGPGRSYERESSRVSHSENQARLERERRDASQATALAAVRLASRLRVASRVQTADGVHSASAASAAWMMAPIDEDAPKPTVHEV